MLDYAEESTGVLRKAESEYKGHHILLICTRNLLSTMQREGVIDRFGRENFLCSILSLYTYSHVEIFLLDRVIFALGVFLFTCAVLYVVLKRINWHTEVAEAG